VLTNVASERVKRVRRLARRSARLETGELLVEGPQACREAALAGLVLDVYLTADAAGRHPEIIAATLASGGHPHEASAEYVRAISPDAQGVAARARDPWAGWTVSSAVAGREAPESDAGLGGAGRRGLNPAGCGLPEPGLGGAVDPDPPGGQSAPQLVAVLEQLRDPGNAGTVIRAADAAGADLVVFADQSVDPAAPKVIRASAGSYFHVPVAQAASVEEAVQQLRPAGLAILAADGAGEEALDRAALGQPTAWLFGNEARGLSAAARAAADQSVRIEIYGRAESLNVAMAATLCLYASAEALRNGDGT
jgi:TrmH family RNA methyltransferase